MDPDRLLVFAMPPPPPPLKGFVLLDLEAACLFFTVRVGAIAVRWRRCRRRLALALGLELSKILARQCLS